MIEGDRDQVVEAIKAALAEAPKRYEIRAWAKWGTPQQKQILAIPVALLHRMWVDETDFRWSNKPAAMAA